MKDNTEKKREKYSEITNANKGGEENDKFKEMKKVTSKVIRKSAILKIMIAMEKQNSKREEKKIINNIFSISVYINNRLICKKFE